MAFKKARRIEGKLKVALFGPSGSGKTLSALMLAAGIAKRAAEKRGEKGFGKVAVIDTENRRSALYANHRSLPQGFEFDIDVIKAPFLPQKYVKMIEDAHKNNYDVVVVDSLSHGWQGSGGMLDQQETGGGGNKFAAWRNISKQHNRLIDAILQTDIHVISTCRSKMSWEMVDQGDGKGTKITKIGLSPIFKEGLEFEMLLVLELDMQHQFTPSKDNTSLVDTPEGKITGFVTPELGVKLHDWLTEGAISKEEFESENETDEELKEAEVDKTEIDKLITQGPMEISKEAIAVNKNSDFDF